MNSIVETHFLPGEILFREGEISFHFYIIHSGEVEIVKGFGNEEVHLAKITPGHSVGEFAMILGSPRSATARALTAVRASMLTEETYQLLLAELPEWAVVVMKAMITRIRTLNEQVEKIYSLQKST
jgi:CRP-like cAMP-binding protein